MLVRARTKVYNNPPLLGGVLGMGETPESGMWETVVEIIRAVTPTTGPKVPSLEFGNM
jgi:hypothetical protein